MPNPGLTHNYSTFLYRMLQKKQNGEKLLLLLGRSISGYSEKIGKFNRTICCPNTAAFNILFEKKSQENLLVTKMTLIRCKGLILTRGTTGCEELILFGLERRWS